MSAVFHDFWSWQVRQSPSHWLYLQRFVCVCLFSGTDPDAEKKIRSFLAHPYCRDYLKFEKGKTYLIMGQTKTLPKIGGKYDIWKMMFNLVYVETDTSILRRLTMMHLHFE